VVGELLGSHPGLLQDAVEGGTEEVAVVHGHDDAQGTVTVNPPSSFFSKTTV